VSRSEYLYVIFELIVGLITFATVLGIIANIVTNVSAARKDFQGKSFFKMLIIKYNAPTCLYWNLHCSTPFKFQTNITRFLGNLVKISARKRIKKHFNTSRVYDCHLKISPTNKKLNLKIFYAKIP
jgi:hypothetical protein